MLQGLVGAVRSGIVLAALCLMAADASGQATPDEAGLNWLRTHVLSGVRGGEKVEHRREVARRLYLESDLDGGGISKSDYALASQLDAATARQPVISNWASKDLDGDGKVTRSELERALVPTALRSFPRYDRGGGRAGAMPSEEQLRLVLDKLVLAALADDLNDDGVVTLEELLGSHRKKAKSDPPRLTRRLVPLSLDGNGDGIVSLEEFDAAVMLVLREMDANQDGEFSDTEAVAARALASALQRAGHYR